MKNTIGLRLAAISLLLLPAACAQGADAASPGGGVAFPDAVALRIEQTGGFVPATFNLTRLPVVTVYADGRVVTQGPQVMIYPGPALPNIQLQRISAADVAKLTALAVAAGVGEPSDLGSPGITDVPSTKFTVQTDKGVKTLEVYALNEATEPQSGLTPAQQAGRAKLQKLVASLTDLKTTLGAGAVGASESYVPAAVAAIASPWEPSADVPASPEVAWPGPKLPGASVGEGMSLGCVEAGGDAGVKVLAAAKDATQITPWTSDGKKWTVVLRPLLPDESSCADLLD